MYYSGLESFPNHPIAKKYLKGTYGGLIAFEIKGSIEAGRPIRASSWPRTSRTSATRRTLVIHPASTTHQQLTPEEQLSTGVTPGLVRLSIGIEDVTDIIADFEQALNRYKPKNIGAVKACPYQRPYGF